MPIRLGVTLLLCLISFAAVIAGPLWVLLLAPIVFGVPHVGADIRYLVLRPYGRGLRGDLLLILAPIFVLLVFGLLAGFGMPRLIGVEIGLGMAAIGIAVSQSRLAEGRKFALLAALLLLAVLMIEHPRPTYTALLHLHNFIAVAIWFTLFRSAGSRSEGRMILIILSGFALAVSAAGYFLPNMFQFAGSPDGFGVKEAAAALMPGQPLDYAAVVIRLYAFMQLMHYVIWLFLVPSSSGAGSLRSDFGAGGLAACAGLTVITITAGYFLPLRTREIYLTASIFHAWLELAVGSYLLLSAGSAAVSFAGASGRPVGVNAGETPDLVKNL